ncbi:MAG: ABC transporter ATP-binding protein [Planctomycetaceae bacterium]
MSACTPLIRIEDVAREFSLGTTTVRALRGVTADVPRGSFQFILGPSGSGKSTLLYLLGALDQPSRGSIEVDGRQIEKMTLGEKDQFRRNEVGFIFQSFNLLGNLTALDNVLVPFLPVGVKPEFRRRAEELLDRVGLENRKRHRPHELSGGEQQRVAIARALLKQPQLVLADEPTGDLDHSTGGEVIGYLRNLNTDHGTTVVLVTHDESYIEAGDQVLRLRDGKIIDQQQA